MCMTVTLLVCQDVKASANGLKLWTLAPTMVKAPEVMILQQQLQEEKQRQDMYQTVYCSCKEYESSMYMATAC